MKFRTRIARPFALIPLAILALSAAAKIIKAANIKIEI